MIVTWRIAGRIALILVATVILEVSFFAHITFFGVAPDVTDPLSRREMPVNNPRMSGGNAGSTSVSSSSVGYSSTITASGGMNCPSGSACPMLLAVFTATVEVVP